MSVTVRKPHLLAIDPGPTESALLLYNTTTKRPVAWEKLPNTCCWPTWAWTADRLAVEQVASYGMPVGAEVFETCVWTGRYIERWYHHHETHPVRVTRKQVMVHVCGSARGNDATLRMALIDRYGGKERAVGRKASPGPLYGMNVDHRAALGVAITATEKDA